jgi:hypothetical protein
MDEFGLVIFAGGEIGTDDTDAALVPRTTSTLDA